MRLAKSDQLGTTDDILSMMALKRRLECCRATEISDGSSVIVYQTAGTTETAMDSYRLLQDDTTR
jgi:hypothetical protein